MSYLPSNKVAVFPSTRRANTVPTSKQMSEAAVVNIINRLIDRDGFIITKVYDRDKEFEFNIHGYYFKVTAASLIQALFTDSLDIYGKITLDNGNPYIELKGQDESDQYTGIEFVNVDPGTSDTVYSLHLFTRAAVTDEWNVYDGSLVKFTSKSVVGLDYIVDGGEI